MVDLLRRGALPIAVGMSLLSYSGQCGERMRLDDPLHPKVVDAIARVQALNDQKDYAGSIAVLTDILELPDATATDLAVARQVLAAAYEWNGDLEAARRLLVAVTETPGSLPKASVDRIWLKRASLGYRVGDHRDAMESIQTWRRRGHKPSAMSYEILALSHLGVGKRAEALLYAQKSAEMSEAAGDIPSASIREILGQVVQ